MGKKLNGRLFRINGKPFRINGELFRVYGKLFHIVFSSCEGSFLAIIGMFGWVLCRFQEANLQEPRKYLVRFYKGKTSCVVDTKLFFVIKFESGMTLMSL